MESSYYNSLLIITLSFLFVTFILGLHNKTIPRREKRAFVVLGSLIALLGIFQRSYSSLNGNPGTVAIVFAYIFRTLAMTDGAALAFVATTSIFKWERKQILLLMIPLFILFILLALSPVTDKLIFHIGEDGVYNRATCFFLYYMFVGGYLLLFLLASIYQSRIYQFRSLFALICIFLFFATIMVIDFILPKIRIATLSISMTFMLYYNYYSDLYFQGDSLTRLLSRRNYDNLRLIGKKKRILVFLDVDDFKLINDNYGHEYGDIVLSEIGGLLLEHFSRHGLCFRFGGDEFVLVLRNSEEDFHKIMDDFMLHIGRMRVADKRFPYISYGYETIVDGDIQKAQASADAMMYEWKEKNKINDKKKHFRSR